MPGAGQVGSYTCARPPPAIHISARHRLGIRNSKSEHTSSYISSGPAAALIASDRGPAPANTDC